MSRQAGFTLVEALVALVLVTAAFALAGELLVESGRLFAAAGRELTDPAAGYALAHLRHDAQGAADATATPGSPDVLTLLGHPAGVIRYQRRGDRLVRTVLDGGGDPLSRRVLLTGLSTWSWSRPGPGLLSVELGYRRHPVPGLAAPRRPPPARPERVYLTLALRGRGRLQRW